MITRAAVVRDGAWDVVDVPVAEPGPGEALVRVVAAGFGRLDAVAAARGVVGGGSRLPDPANARESGERARPGARVLPFGARPPAGCVVDPPRHPVAGSRIGGHEGVGVVERVGPSVTRVRPGDTVVVGPQPMCGTCRSCSTGRQFLCERGLGASTAAPGTFAGHLVCSEHLLVPVHEPVPAPVAALLGATVLTGWGAAVRAAGVAAGDTVVVYGAGGVGAAAVMGARLAGARHVVVVDPVAFRRERASAVGATAAVATAAEARALVDDATWGRLAEHAIVAVAATDDAVLEAALDVVGKTGTVTVAAHGPGTLRVPSGRLIGFQRTVRGTRLGDTNPLADVPRLVALHTSGRLALDALVTRTHTLDEIGEAARDLDDGAVVRGVVLLDGDGR